MKKWLPYILVLIAFIGAFMSGYHKGLKKAPQTQITPRVDTVIIWDTIVRETPIPAAKRVVDVVCIPVRDTIVLHDSIFVRLEREQVYYHEDGLYSAWVSGVEPSLDSVAVYQKTVWKSEQEKRNHIIVRADYRRCNYSALAVSALYGRSFGNFTIWGGAGYDFLQRCPEINIGAHYDIKWR